MRLLIVLLGLLLPTCVFADAAATAALIKILSGVNSMQADFVQLTQDGKGRAQPVQSGKMAVKRPGHFRWQVEKPSPQMVLTSGKTLWIYDPELMQATKQKLDAQVGNTPALLLSGDPRQLNDAFVITQGAGRVTEQVFVLKPREKEALFESLQVRFVGNQLQQMLLVDSLGQKTDIRFSQIKVNPTLAAAQFEFTPPAGVDVIDQL